MASLHFNPPVIAHRGASGHAPENTMSAFVKAAQLGIKWIEFDVMLAACGEPIIFHDDNLERTTTGKGEVGSYPYAFLRTLDAGSWMQPRFSGETIPTLKHVIEFLNNAKISANVEIKAKPGQEEALIVRVLEEMSEFLSATKSTILFSSFSRDALHLLRKHSPDCLLGLLMHEWEPNWKDVCQALNCASVNVNQEVMTHERAQEVKHVGKPLLCYTVNNPARARELYSWGVDAVFSDYPDKILQGI